MPKTNVEITPEPLPFNAGCSAEQKTTQGVSQYAQEGIVCGASATTRYQMAAKGLVVFRGALDAMTIASLRSDVEMIYHKRRAVQLRNGVAAGMEGAAHHVLGEHTSLDLLIADLPLQGTIAEHFGGKFILLNFGMSLLAPGGSNYVSKPHRDIRAWTRDYPLSMNMLIMLDDFTQENGATRFLAGSHHVEAMPPRETFNSDSEQVLGKAGDIILFDSLVVHAAAANRSAAPRRALTLCFGRPFMKPQMDWPRFLPKAMEAALTPCARQLLGYDARVAASLEEYYQPPERWTFKPDQR